MLSKGIDLGSLTSRTLVPAHGDLLQTSDTPDSLFYLVMLPTSAAVASVASACACKEEVGAAFAGGGEEAVRFGGGEWPAPSLLAEGGWVAPGCREEARATRRVPSISSRPRKPTSARRARLAVARKGLMPPPRMIANPSAFAAKPIAPVLHIAAISAAPQPASKAVSRKGSKVARRLGATFLVGPDEPGSLPFPSRKVFGPGGAPPYPCREGGGSRGGAPGRQFGRLSCRTRSVGVSKISFFGNLVGAHP